MVQQAVEIFLIVIRISRALFVRKKQYNKGHISIAKECSGLLLSIIVVEALPRLSSKIEHHFAEKILLELEIVKIS